MWYKKAGWFPRVLQQYPPSITQPGTNTQPPLSAVCFAVPVCWKITVKSQVRLLLPFRCGKGVVFLVDRIYLGCSYEKMCTLLLTSTHLLSMWKKVIVWMSLFQKLHVHSYTTWLTSSLNIICNDQHHFQPLGSESSSLLFCFFFNIILHVITTLQAWLLHIPLKY